MLAIELYLTLFSPVSRFCFLPGRKSSLCIHVSFSVSPLGNLDWLLQWILVLGNKCQIRRVSCRQLLFFLPAKNASVKKRQLGACYPQDRRKERKITRRKINWCLKHFTRTKKLHLQTVLVEFAKISLVANPMSKIRRVSAMFHEAFHLFYIMGKTSRTSFYFGES